MNAPQGGRPKLLSVPKLKRAQTPGPTHLCLLRRGRAQRPPLRCGDLRRRGIQYSAARNISRRSATPHRQARPRSYAATPQALPRPAHPDPVCAHITAAPNPGALPLAPAPEASRQLPPTGCRAFAPGHITAFAPASCPSRSVCPLLPPPLPAPSLPLPPPQPLPPPLLPPFLPPATKPAPALLASSAAPPRLVRGKPIPSNCAYCHLTKPW